MLFIALTILSNCMARKKWAQLYVLPSKHQFICTEKRDELNKFYKEALDECKEIELDSQKINTYCSYYMKYRGVYCATEKNYDDVISSIPSDVEELEFNSYVQPEKGYDLNKLKGNMAVYLHVGHIDVTVHSMKNDQKQKNPKLDLSLNLVGNINNHVSFLFINFYETFLTGNKLKIVDSELNVNSVFLKGAVISQDSMNISSKHFIVDKNTHNVMVNSHFEKISKVGQYSLFLGNEYSNGFQIRFYDNDVWSLFYYNSLDKLVGIDLNAKLRQVPYNYANELGIIFNECSKVSLWCENKNTSLKGVNVSIIQDFNVETEKQPISGKALSINSKNNLPKENKVVHIIQDGEWPEPTVEKPYFRIIYDNNYDINFDSQDLGRLFNYIEMKLPNNDEKYDNIWNFKPNEQQNESGNEKESKANIGLIIGLAIVAVVAVVLLIVVIILVIRLRRNNASQSEKEIAQQ